MKPFSEQVWNVCGKAMTVAAFVMLVAILAGFHTTGPKIITQVQFRGSRCQGRF